MLNEIAQAITDEMERRCALREVVDGAMTDYYTIHWPVTAANEMAAAVVAVISDYEYLVDPFIAAIPDDIVDLLTVEQIYGLVRGMADAAVHLIGSHDA